MAKTTTKKTTEKKPVKTVTMADLDKRLRAVEATNRRQNGLIAAHAVTVSKIKDKLDKIESKVSDDAAFRLFVQSLAKERNEQEVPPKVAYMVKMLEKEIDSFINMPGGTKWFMERIPKEITQRNQRFCDAIVEYVTGLETAKALGLVAVNPKPWKPEVGQLAAVIRSRTIHMVKDILGSAVELETVDGLVPMNWLDQPTSEEVSKYHAEIEAAKPIVPYVTRVKFGRAEWYVVYVPCDPAGMYSLHRTDADGHHGTARTKRHEFTVID